MTVGKALTPPSLFQEQYIETNAGSFTWAVYVTALEIRTFLRCTQCQASAFATTGSVIGTWRKGGFVILHLRNTFRGENEIYH